MADLIVILGFTLSGSLFYVNPSPKNIQEPKHKTSETFQIFI